MFGVSQNVCKINVVFLEFQVIAVVAVNYSLLWVVTPLICQKFVKVSKKCNLLLPCSGWVIRKVGLRAAAVGLVVFFIARF